MKPDSSQWCNPVAYEFVKDAPADAIAWEFLRRNPDYQSDFILLQSRGAQALTPAMRQYWGLQFRRSP